MERNPASSRAGDGERPSRSKLPLLHRASDGDERRFRLDSWSAEFEDVQLEAQFQRHLAHELHERAWFTATVAAVVLLLLGIEEVAASTWDAADVVRVVSRFLMVAPLVAYAVRGRPRRDQLNQLPFDLRSAAALEAWLFACFVVHVAVHDDPWAFDTAVLSVSFLVCHLVVPNRWRYLAPLTIGTAVAFTGIAAIHGGSWSTEVLPALTLVIASAAGGALFHRRVEIGRRSEYMAVERAAQYGERLERAVQRAHDLEEELRRQVNIDPLTSIGNRRWFFGQLDLEFARGRRTRRPVSVLILDVDHFKQINDRHGHPVGDEVLKHLTAIVRTTLRTTDRLARIGGEEFAVVMPETDLRDAHDVAERIRAAVVANPVLIRTGAIRLTVSVGVTLCQAEVEEPTQALARADKALYEAKRGGRDLVIAR